MIERDERAVKHQESVLVSGTALCCTVVVILLLIVQRRFEPIGRSITQIAHSAARKRTKIGPACEFVFAKVSPEIFRHAFVACFNLTFSLYGCHVGSAANDHVRIRAQERMRGYFFSAFDRFEKKSVARVAGDIHKRVNRIHRFRRDSPRHRNNVAAFGVLLKLRERGGLNHK